MYRNHSWVLSAFFTAMLWWLTAGISAMAATYYVRTDGGTAWQCTGKVDAPYPGSGQQQPCAWNHPFWALDGNAPPSWRIQGGDTLLVHAGSYRMGIAAPNTGWCEADMAYDCHLPPLPSGSDSAHPTRLLGGGWNEGCRNPPELWGAERPWQILSLADSSHVVVACLEITDHSGCVEFHADPAICCNRNASPYGDWAAAGIYAADSSDVVLRDLNIHGLASAGIRAGRISDWRVENVRIAGNGWVGWEGDLGEPSSNSGMLWFRDWTVEWNGCAEGYPEEDPGHCWAQPAGGYGDGVGTAATGGHWLIEDAVFRYNTSDGLDLLYVREPDTHIEIRRCRAYGNAGNQIKVNGPAHIENTLMVGNCGFFYGKSFAPPINGQDPIDHCRACGNSLALAVQQGEAVSLVNSTIVGQGDCLGEFTCDARDCNGTESLVSINNIFQGYGEFQQHQEQTCYFWVDREDFYDIQWDYNLLFDVGLGSYLPPLGPEDKIADPGFVIQDLEKFDGRLGPESPALDSGLPVGTLGLVPSMDLEGVARPQGSGVDRGALERPVGGEFSLRIAANGSTAPLTVAEGEPVSITVSLEPGNAAGVQAEWWVAVNARLAAAAQWFSYVYPTGWYCGLTPCIVLPVMRISGVQVFNGTLPIGAYTFYFALDAQINGVPEPAALAEVQVLVE